MAYWFHRNPFKATVAVNFDCKMTTAQVEAIQICGELQRRRSKLIESLSDPKESPTGLEEEVKGYLSFLMGMLDGPVDGTGRSKLRHLIRFKWTQTLLGSTPIVFQDVLYEMISICQEYGIWLMKHSAMISAKEEVSMEEAKIAHKCLKKGAGIFQSMDSEFVGRLLEKAPSGSDLDSRISTAYVKQCLAEAQEITIARAIELKHSPSLVSSLAAETSTLFLSAASSVKALDPTIVGKWMKYFTFKSAIYNAYAYTYHGENLLALEKCGDAIRSLKEAEKYHEATLAICKEYSKMKGPGKSAKPEEHLFFRKLGPLIKRTMDKCNRENSLIFHQKVSMELVPLETKASHGLVNPDPFVMPAMNPIWSTSAYDAFTLVPNGKIDDPAKGKPEKGKESKPEKGKESKPEKGKESKPEKDIPPVNEKSWTSTNQDPKNESGCVLS